MATWSVILGDSVATSGLSGDVITTIENGLIAAGEDWEKYFVTADANIEIRLEIEDTDTDRSTGGSISSVFIENNGQQDIFLDTAAAKLNDGSDNTSGDAEIVVIIDPDYLADILHLDGTPLARTDEIPIDRVDSQSVFLHEIGHGLGFSGFVNTEADLSNQLDFLVFDTFIEFQDGVPFFTGAAATNIYGADIPLTKVNVQHVGNDEPLPGSDLIPDLMNGVVFFRDFRYFISPLDTAILADTGLILKVPTDNADDIYGYENEDDQLNLLRGNDIFHGLSGNDVAKGGPGSDTLFGGSGDDKLIGGGGADVLNGGNGNDDLRGKGGNDVLIGGAGNDKLEGHKGTDTLDGGNGDDTYTVHAKEDSVDTYADSGTDSGTDTIDASRVDDLLLSAAFSAASSGIEVIVGDGATRIVSGDAVANWDFSGITLNGIKELKVTGDNDVVVGSDGDDKIKGLGGVDSLSGGNGDDKLIGGGGGDSLDGGSGNDVLKGGGGDGSLTVPVSDCIG